MGNNQPICICFAGAVGSSKTPIANYLSYKLNLPVFNTDAIRSEVTEDLSFFDEQAFKERRDSRISEIIDKKISIIFDASQDREWSNFKKILSENGYSYFIISLDLSKEKLTKFYNNKGYSESLLRLDKLIAEHNKFIEENNKEISLVINDDNFLNRLDVCYLAVSKYLESSSN